MADPILPNNIPGICTSQDAMSLYIQQLNLSFELMIKAINETLDVEFKLPGVPPLPLRGLPPVTLGGFELPERKLNLRRPPNPLGYSGNVFPLRYQTKQVKGKLAGLGIPDLTIGGTEGPVVPGLDPSTYILNLLGMNYELLINQLATEGITVAQIPFPRVDLCAPGEGTTGPGGASVGPGQALINELIREQNQIITDEVEGGGGACINTLVDGFEPFTHADYDTFESASGDVGIVPGSDFVNFGWDSSSLAESSALLTGNLFSGYAGTSPVNLFACGNAFEFTYDGVVTLSGGTGILSVVLWKISTDNTSSVLDSEQISLIGAGTTGTQTRTLSVPAGVVDGTDVVAIQVEARFQGAALTSGSAQMDNSSLLDLGP